MREPRTVAVAWAAFQCQPRARGPHPTWLCQHCAGWLRAGLPLEIGPLTLFLLFYFLNIFKSLQIQKKM
jgi:hypothetical protein